MAFKITAGEKKLILKNRVKAEQDFQDSCEWLYSWYEMSYAIPTKYKTLRFASNKLLPLKVLMPYKPNKIRTLYRVIGSDKELKPVLKLLPNKLYSCTSLKGKKNWVSISNQTGAFDYENTYVIEIDQFGVSYLFDTEWVIKVLPLLKSKIDSGLFNRLKEETSAYRWQKEVVLFSNMGIKATIKERLYWDQ